MSVWSDTSYSAWANKSSEGRCKKQQFFNSTTSYAFGSQNKFGNSGSRSLPSCKLDRNSNLYNSELSSSSSKSYDSLSFKAEAKEFSWNLSPFKSSVWNSPLKNSPWTSMLISGGSSRFSSGNVSKDWRATVDAVFVEEIQLMAEECYNKKE